MTTLYVRDVDTFRVATDTELLTRARTVIARRYRRGAPVLSDEKRTADFLQTQLVDLPHEVFGLIHLDSHHRLIAVEQLFRGTLTETQVHLREVVRSAIQHASAGVILFHNHPSGVSEPSAREERMTHRIREALALIDVRVHDHLIVGDPVFSFAQASRL